MVHVLHPHLHCHSLSRVQEYCCSSAGVKDENFKLPKWCEFLFIKIPYVLHLQMSNNIPGLETENDIEDVDIKPEPLELDLDDCVSMTGYFSYNLRIPRRNLLMVAIH